MRTEVTLIFTLCNIWGIVNTNAKADAVYNPLNAYSQLSLTQLSQSQLAQAQLVQSQLAQAQLVQAQLDQISGLDNGVLGLGGGVPLGTGGGPIGRNLPGVGPLTSLVNPQFNNNQNLNSLTIRGLKYLCGESFGGESISTYNCARKCGLCELCRTNPSVPECQKWCALGEEACARNCEEGKALCFSCGPTCAVY